VNGVIDYDAESQAGEDKNLWTVGEYGDFVLRLEWRIKETPYVNPGVPYILPDGTHAKDTKGKELHLSLPDSDSGIYLRGQGKYQINIWCWPIGSGEMYGVRTDPKTSPEVRAAVTPRNTENLAADARARIAEIDARRAQLKKAIEDAKERGR